MEPPSDPFASSGPPTPTPDSRDLGELPNRPPIGSLSNETTPRASERGFRDSSVDPLAQNTPFRPLFTSANRQSRTELGAKRGPPGSPSLIDNHIDKNPRIDYNFASLASQTHQNQTSFRSTQEDRSIKLVLESRDLLVKAYSATQSRVKQARLLDLLEVFREFTEHGRIRNSTTILATQVANLEQATRKIEKQASNSIKPAKPANPANPADPANPAEKSTWAKVANNAKNQGNSDQWTDIRPKGNGTRAKGVARPSPKETIGMGTNSGKGEFALTKRCTLLQARNVQANTFSPIAMRNLLNLAFNKKGIQGQVISTVSLSLRGNIVVTTTPCFDVDFLILHEAVIRGVLPLLTTVKRGDPWYKVAIHGIPIREFDTEEGLDSKLVAEEIRIFNKDLTPVGNSYWATPKEKRDSGLVQTGTIIVAFPNQDQAKRAISNRLFIAGISAKVVKYITTPSTSQCTRCAGFGHSETLCKRAKKCILCAEDHTSKQHYCSTCEKTSTKCLHLSMKCANCSSTTHMADSKLCEVYLAVKNKAYARKAGSTSEPCVVNDPITIDDEL